MNTFYVVDGGEKDSPRDYILVDHDNREAWEVVRNVSGKWRLKDLDDYDDLMDDLDDDFVEIEYDSVPTNVKQAFNPLYKPKTRKEMFQCATNFEYSITDYQIT